MCGELGSKVSPELQEAPWLSRNGGFCGWTHHNSFESNSTKINDFIFPFKEKNCVHQGFTLKLHLKFFLFFNMVPYAVKGQAYLSYIIR